MPLREEMWMSREPDAAEALILSLLLTREHLAAFLETRVFEPAGLTDAQFNALRIVRGGPAEGYPVGEIRRRLLTRHADVPRLVDRLASQGLLRRAAHPQDRRCSLVQITDQGRVLLDRLQPLLDAATEEVGRALPAETRDAVVQALATLRQNLQDTEKA